MRRHQKKDMDAMRRGNAMRQWTAAGGRKKTLGRHMLDRNAGQKKTNCVEYWT